MDRTHLESPTRIHVDDAVIRPATENDAATIGDLWVQLVDYHHELDSKLPTATEDGSQRYARHIVERIHDRGTQAFVAEIDGRVVGFILGVIVDLAPEMFEHETSGFVADLFVEETYRQTGVGRKLVVAMAGWFRAHGLGHMEWYVAMHNTSGRAFWQALGGRDVMARMRAEL